MIRAYNGNIILGSKNGLTICNENGKFLKNVTKLKNAELEKNCIPMKIGGCIGIISNAFSNAAKLIFLNENTLEKIGEIEDIVLVTPSLNNQDFIVGKKDNKFFCFNLLWFQRKDREVDFENPDDCIELPFNPRMSRYFLYENNFYFSSKKDNFNALNYIELTPSSRLQDVDQYLHLKPSKAKPNKILHFSIDGRRVHQIFQKKDGELAILSSQSNAKIYFQDCVGEEGEKIIDKEGERENPYFILHPTSGLYNILEDFNSPRDFENYVFEGKVYRRADDEGLREIRSEKISLVDFDKKK